MKSDGNRLFFDREVKGNPLSATAALHNIIKKQGYQDITLDFSNTARLYPDYMIPLVATCRSYRSDKVDFEIILPSDRKASAHLCNTNWSHLIAPEKFECQESKNIKHMSAVQFFTAEEHYKAVDDSISTMLSCVEGLDRNRLKALEWALNEITDNVLNHSKSSIGGILQVVSIPSRRRVEFFVCDSGVTIPRSLRSGRPDIADDISALRQAIEEGVTSNKQTNQGNGLFGTFRCCEVSGGEFDIISGAVFLQHKPGELRVGRSPIPFQGTYVRASIDYSFEKLLEKSLVFKGKEHDPGYDFIERRYENENNHIDFVVKDELSAFGSRDAGKLARNKIENLMNQQKMSIDFDFEGVRLISSSFADEVFGMLFVKLGPIKFTQLCHFKNIDTTVQGLIDRAISQRVRA